MPAFFYATKKFFSVVKAEKPRLAWMKGMHVLDKLTKKLGLRKKTCWYHEPKKGWRFDDPAKAARLDPPPPEETPKDIFDAKGRLQAGPGFGVAPNLHEVEKA